MDIQQIKILLDKYDKAETSLEEELVLRDYFSKKSEIPVGFEAYKIQFQYFESVRKTIHRKPELEKRLESLVGQEPSMKTITLLNTKSFKWMAAAAMVIIIGTMVLIVNRNQRPDLGTFDDPELAYVEAQKALLFISQKLNHGTKELSYISKINSGIEDLKNLEKLNSGLDKLKLISKLNETSTEEKK
jgi:hypothetical protein